MPVLEEGLIWRRDRLPTITVRADVVAVCSRTPHPEQIDRQLADLRAKLPPGFRIELGGSTEGVRQGREFHQGRWSR